MPKVNPEILRWARETSSLTATEAAEKLLLREAEGMLPVARLASLETGESEPTRPMLVKMAKLYRRPLLTFYMAAPPRKGNRGQDFRTLPKDYSRSDDALLDVLIRDTLARQAMVRAILEDEEETKMLPFVSSSRISNGVENVLASIKMTLKFDQVGFYSQPSPDEAFNMLRAKVEAVGVFVLLIGDLGSHHTKMDTGIFRGFALADQVAPFIIINDQDSHAAWSFTLIHELVHLWLGQTGISGATSDIDIERFCNDVAGEFLLPAHEIIHLNIGNSTAFQTAVGGITEFARSRNLSSSMVAYKLYRRGNISRENWQKLSKAFQDRWHETREQRERAPGQKGGPNYYTVRRHRLGTSLIQLVDRVLAGGALTTSKAGKVLGVKAKNVQALIDRGRSRTGRPT
jgi:Zn-dependent peptidase ImmA (M78 family)